MTEQIKVTVAAPGANQAANEMDAAAAAAEKLAASERKVAEAAAFVEKHQRMTTESVKANRASMEAAAAAAQKFQAVMTSTGVKFQPVREELAKARREAELLGDAMGSGGGGGHGGHGGNRGAYWLSRLAPGHEMQIMNAASAVGPGAVPAIAGVMAGLALLGTAFKVNAELVERHNNVTMTNLELDQQLAKAARDQLMAQQERAGQTLSGIRSAARFILYNDPRGADAIRQVQSQGLGEAGIRSLSNLLQHRGMRFSNQWDASAFLRESEILSRMTGLDQTEILDRMGSDQGRYNRNRFLRSVSGRTYSPEMLQQFRRGARDTDIDQLLDKSLYEDQRRGRFELGNALDPSMAVPGMERTSEDLINPMSKVIRDHNFTLQQSIDLQKQMQELDKSYMEAIRFFLDKTGLLISSKTASARVEQERLETLRR